MINLEKTSGLPIAMTDEFGLQFNPPLKQKDPDIVRKYTDMQDLFLDPAAKPSLDVLYEVYRKIALQDDVDLLNKHKLQYDVTILPAAMIGKEFNKTYGHYHANIQGSAIAHPEVYEVLSGNGLVLLQKMDADFKTVLTVLSIQLGVGDKVIYPPNYGHIWVNTGTDPLVIANFLSTEYKPIYEHIKERKGMAYYVVAGQNEEPVFVKNEKYQDQPAVRKMTIADKIKSEFGLTADEPMYLSFKKNPELFEFLNNPAKYAIQMSTLSS